jgi:hypothetical protein
MWHVTLETALQSAGVVLKVNVIKSRQGLRFSGWASDLWPTAVMWIVLLTPRSNRQEMFNREEGLCEGNRPVA